MFLVKCYYDICIKKLFVIIKNIINRHSTHYIAATTLRNAIGAKKLTEILNDRRAVSLQVFESMRNMTHNWGVQVLRVEMLVINFYISYQNIFYRILRLSLPYLNLHATNFYKNHKALSHLKKPNTVNKLN